MNSSRHEELVIAALLIVVCSIPILSALVDGEAFGASATVGLLGFSLGGYTAGKELLRRGSRSPSPASPTGPDRDAHLARTRASAASDARSPSSGAIVARYGTSISPG
jgi:hypothetical protein